MRRHPVTGTSIPRLSALALAAASVGMLGGCSSTPNDLFKGQSADYGSAKAGAVLDVPPDLTQLARSEQFAMPDAGKTAAVSARSYQSATAQSAQQSDDNTVLPQYPGMHVEQQGSQRWLVVDLPADALWDKTKVFWQQNGFDLTTADPATGEMKTDWAENRAKLPQDIIRKYVGKVFDSLYDTGERDSYRTLFERSADGKSTQVFISHQTMVEVYTDTAKTQTTWQPGAADPAMDTVMLRRLMVYLGMKEEQAKAAVAGSAPQAAAAPQASLVANGNTLQLQDGFDEAWRKVGLAINTAGFTVTDRNRGEGRYDVRYVNPAESLKDQQDQGGFFSRLFSSSKPEAKPGDYHILVVGSGDVSTVSVHAVQSGAAAEQSEQDILKVLLQQLQ
jgi:outer membrane protein assembly factor BamC